MFFLCVSVLNYTLVLAYVLLFKLALRNILTKARQSLICKDLLYFPKHIQQQLSVNSLNGTNHGKYQGESDLLLLLIHN